MTCAGRKPAHFSFTKSLLLIVVLAIVNTQSPSQLPSAFCVVRENFRKIAAEAEETNIINQHLAIPTRERGLYKIPAKKKIRNHVGCTWYLLVGWKKSARVLFFLKMEDGFCSSSAEKRYRFFSKLFCRFGARVKIIFHPAAIYVREEVYFHYIKN